MPIFDNKLSQHVSEISRMLADMAHFIHPDIVKRIQSKNDEEREKFEELLAGKVDARHYLSPGSACVFPGFRRPPANIPVRGNRLRYNDKLRGIVDDNWSPRHIWCYIALGARGKPNSGPNWKECTDGALELAHLFPHKDDTESLLIVRDMFSKVGDDLKPFGNFSSAGNTVLLPKGSVRPTDQSPEIKKVFFRRYIELYGEETLCDMRGFKYSAVPQWYNEMQWNEPVLPVNWRERIDNLVQYRTDRIESILSNT